MRVLAPAKLNRFLAVLGRRADGFHALELVTTVLEGVEGLQDVLEVEPALFEHFSIGGPLAGDLEMTEDNLVVKAWRLLEREAGRDLPVRVHLEKHIPAGGGLGGGSSDAAAVLKAGNEVFGLGLGPDVLLRLAATLGSDVPLFLLGGTVLGLDRGERVFPLRPLPLEPMILVHPRMHVSTPAVYKALAEVGYPDPSPLAGLDEGQMPPWRNDLRAAAIAVEPRLEEVEAALCDVGGDPLLCGSGACWVARFTDITARNAAFRELSSSRTRWGLHRI